LIYIKARWYDPLTAAWISKDPLGFPGGNYNSLYRYVGNNPVTGVDPSGLGTWNFPSCGPKGSPAGGWQPVYPIAGKSTCCKQTGQPAGSGPDTGDCYGGGCRLYVLNGGTCNAIMPPPGPPPIGGRPPWDCLTVCVLAGVEYMSCVEACDGTQNINELGNKLQKLGHMRQCCSTPATQSDCVIQCDLNSNGLKSAYDYLDDCRGCCERLPNATQADQQQCKLSCCDYFKILQPDGGDCDPDNSA
jgi:hypothetical protein